MQASKSDVVMRLASIGGHVMGIRTMVEEDRPCPDILR